METLHDDSSCAKEFEITEAESTQKTIIQPNFDLYLGVGSKCYSGNPYKRWKNIEEEERELIEEIQTGTDKKYRDRDRSRENYNEKNAKAYDYHTRMQYPKYREQVKSNEGYRGSHKSVDDRDYHSIRNDERSSSSRYNYEKYTRNKSDMNDSKNKDAYSDSHRSSDKHKKKSKKHSRELSDDSYNSIDKHKKKRKKKSRERSAHKKKHRKSKHRDSGTE